MIVFPQTYNYRLIIGSLILALTVLGVFTVHNQNKLEEYNSYLAQEKKLIQNELSEMISRFDTIDGPLFHGTNFDPQPSLGQFPGLPNSLFKFATHSNTLGSEV